MKTPQGFKRTSRAKALDVANDPKATLAHFKLDDLAQFKRGGTFDDHASPDFRDFYVGRDDVHGVLAYLLSHTSRSLYMNMFGYDDDALDATIVHLIEAEHVYTQCSLDRSQAGGVHESKILAAHDDAVRSSFAILTSATGDISHTKGGVCDGKVGWNGSTNWSASGEGTFVQPDGPGGPKYHAQNNTLTVFVSAVEVAEFVAELNEEHSAGLARAARLAKKS